MAWSKQILNEVHILLTFTRYNEEKFRIILDKLFGKKAKISKISKPGVYLLTLPDGQASLATFRASFDALFLDVDSIAKALVIPCDDQFLYSYIDEVKEGRLTYLFELEKNHPNFYDEMVPLLLGVKKSLLGSLKSYIENNCSIRCAQNELYVHFNTVEYRMRKCMQQLRRNFDLFPTRMFLYYLLERVENQKR